MDNLTNIEDIKSLVDDVDNFFSDPNFKPKEQNKYFFSEGTSYYKQLLQVCKIIKLLQTSIKALYSNEEKLKANIEELNLDDIKDLPQRVTELETKATDLTSRVVVLESGVSTNKANIETNKEDINKLTLRVSTNETNITSLNTAITSLTNLVNSYETRVTDNERDIEQLQDNEKLYLQDVLFNSTDIEFVQVSKVNGIATYTAVIKSATPVNLNENLSIANTTNATLVTNIGNLALDSESDEKSIKVNHANTYLSGGSLHTHTDSNIALSKDNFMINGNGAIDTKLDYEETTNKLTEITNNVSAIQEDVNINTNTITSNITDISTLKEKDTSLQASIDELKPQVTNNTSNIASLGTSINTLDEEYKAQQETLDDFNTLISNNQGNIASNTTALNKLKSRVDITHNGTCGYVNSNYERKQLTLTTELLDKIKSGDFSDVVCGNYFTLGGHNFSVMGADVLLNTGDTQLTQHHLVVMCDDLYIGTGSSLMNDSNTTEGGYQGSKMWKTTIPSIVDELNSLFLNRIISHRELQSNAVSNGAVTNWAWSWNDVKVNIPSEPQVYGCRVFSNGGSNIGNCYSQFPLFRIAPQYICCRQHYWLKDVVSATGFAHVYYNGHANYFYASDTSIGVRPYFLIG